MNMKNFGLAAVTAASVLALAACGGGSDAPAPAAPAGTGSTPTALSISGTAATGAAIIGGTVDAKCAAGTATPATTANLGGAYTVSVTGGTLPCVLNVTSGSTVLHSIVAAAPSSGGIVANITPLTELVVANVAGGSPATLFATFDASAQARVTPAAVTAAISTTAAALQGTVDLTGVNPISDTLVATTGSTAGNALGVILGTLEEALATSQTSLAELTTAVTSTPAINGPVLQTIAASATSCAAMRSGIYRTINPHETTNDPAYAAYRLKFDAAALTLTDVEPSHQPAAPALPDSVTLTPVAGSPCRFTYAGEFGTETVLVSPSGAIVVRSNTANGGPVRTSFIIPEQTLPLGQLAGTWNFLAYDRDESDPLTPLNGRAVIDATGQVTDGEDCLGLSCTAYTPADVATTKFAVNANGGFNFTYDQGSPDRAFAFKTADGAIALFVLGRSESGISVLTKQVELPLPAVGAATSFWDFTVGSGAFRFAQTNGASALADSTTTVTAVDAATKSVTRIRTSDQRVDTSVFNNPRNGLRYRAAATSQSTNGVVNVSEAVFLPLTGTGLVFYSSVAANANFLGISIIKP